MSQGLHVVAPHLHRVGTSFPLGECTTIEKGEMRSVVSLRFSPGTLLRNTVVNGQLFAFGPFVIIGEKQWIALA